MYTGSGKGKTTASLGVMLRALGHDYRVLMIQFMKGRKDTGEMKVMKKLPGLEIVQYAEEGLVNLESPSATDIYLANQALEYARKRATSKTARPDIMVMDEINVAVRFGLVSLEEVLAFIDNKPSSMELIMTGRYAHPQILDRADLITEMKEVRHYYKKGVPARQGIEM